MLKIKDFYILGLPLTCKLITNQNNRNEFSMLVQTVLKLITLSQKFKYR